MKVTLEPTDKVVTIRSKSGGFTFEARVWQGETDAGTPVHAYITRIAVPVDAPEEERARFERELGAEKSPPRPEVAAIPLRMIL